MKAEELAELLQTVPECDVVTERFGSICDIRVDIGSGPDYTGKVIIRDGKVIEER